MIVARAQQLGVASVLQEYKLSYSVYARWKLQLMAQRSASNSDALLKRVQELEQENFRLKDIITTLLLQKDPNRDNKARNR